MTAQLVEPTAAVASVGVVVMTREEARACVERIKASAEEIRALIFELHEREGWRALGYATWQDCIRQEFAMSRQRAYQLINAYTVDRILAGGDVNNVDADPIPESHARELAPLVDDPDTLRAVHAEVTAEHGEQTTAEHMRGGVGKVLKRPTRAPKPRPERRSVSSKAELGDFTDDAPDYAVQSQDTYGDASNAEPWCQDCGGKYRGERCPCATTPADLADMAGEYPNLAAHMAKDPDLADAVHEIASGAPAPDQPGDAGVSAGEADTSADPMPASPAADPYDEGDPFDDVTPHPDGISPPVGLEPGLLNDDRADEQIDRQAQHHTAARSTSSSGSGHTSVSEGAGAKDRVPAARVFTPRGLDAGDVARALLDLPIGKVAEALAENATPAQKQALREALGGAGGVQAPAPPAAPAPDLRETLADDGCTIQALTEAIGETFTVEARASLLALLADALPAERLAPLAHRLAVRTRGTDTPVADEIAPRLVAMTRGQRLLTISRTIDEMPADELEAIENRARTQRAKLARLAANGSR